MPSKNREDIKVGDKVQIVDKDSIWTDLIATVETIHDFSVVAYIFPEPHSPRRRLAFDEVKKI